MTLVKTQNSSSELLKLFPRIRESSFFHIQKNIPGLSRPCSVHWEAYTNSLLSNQPAQWALSMFDSSTKIPEGILAATLTHLGNFDECINVRDVETSEGVFHGQHCLAVINVQSTAKAVPVVLASLALKIAACVPSSCRANDTGAILGSVLDLKGIKINAVVDENECNTQDKPSFKTEDWVAVGIFSFFGVLVVISTAYDILKQKSESRSNLMLAFSLYTNGRKLFTTSRSEDTLHCLHGIRFLSIAWVILGHRYTLEVSLPAINSLAFITEFLPDWKHLGITNATLSVDTFFLLSGLLVAYVFFKQVPKTNSFNVPLYYLHRYIRLTPAYAAIILFDATLFSHVSSGPVWSTTVLPVREACSEVWWSSLLYVHTYVHGTVKQCVPQSWYLADDMQFFWLSPLVLIPLWKMPKLGWMLMGLLTVGGLVSNFVLSYVRKYPGLITGLMNASPEDTTDFNEHFYMPAYTRFVPYLIGIALGYLLVDLKEKGRKIKLSKVLTLGLWLVTCGMLLLCLCIVHVFQQPGYEYDDVAESFYNTLGRPGWALGVAMVIILCSTGHGGFPNTFLSWEWFQVLSRISYSIYLVHVTVQLIQQGSSRTLFYLEDMYAMSRFFGDLIFSILSALVLSLVFESPFLVLEKELLGGRRKAKVENKPSIP
ncbi:nose resistant to fluoxetine protein 6 [Anabrus simplex]|uniref:nose resistant to fluoxetine protein 6 n=1 Tax=Anabrus simplex TaxID=316456 RepID=UPI0035A261D4